MSRKCRILIEKSRPCTQHANPFLSLYEHANKHHKMPDHTPNLQAQKNSRNQLLFKNNNNNKKNQSIIYFSLTIQFQKLKDKKVISKSTPMQNLVQRQCFNSSLCLLCRPWYGAVEKHLHSFKQPYRKVSRQRH